MPYPTSCKSCRSPCCFLSSFSSLVWPEPSPDPLPLELAFIYSLLFEIPETLLLLPASSSLSTLLLSAFLYSPTLLYLSSSFLKLSECRLFLQIRGSFTFHVLKPLDLLYNSLQYVCVKMTNYAMTLHSKKGSILFYRPNRLLLADSSGMRVSTSKSDGGLLSLGWERIAAPSEVSSSICGSCSQVRVRWGVRSVQHQQ